jgi:hypothetical protein
MDPFTGLGFSDDDTLCESVLDYEVWQYCGLPTGWHDSPMTCLPSAEIEDYTMQNNGCFLSLGSDESYSNSTMGITNSHNIRDLACNPPFMDSNTLVNTLAESLTSQFVGQSWEQFNMNQDGLGLSSSCECHHSFECSEGSINCLSPGEFYNVSEYERHMHSSNRTRHSAPPLESNFLIGSGHDEPTKMCSLRSHFSQSENNPDPNNGHIFHRHGSHSGIRAGSANGFMFKMRHHHPINERKGHSGDRTDQRGMTEWGIPQAGKDVVFL